MLAPRTFIDPARPKPKKKRKWLRRVALKKAAKNRLYNFRAKRFKAEHPICEICGHRKTQDVHHTRGRHFGNLLEELTWLALCRTCHRYVHDHPKESRAKGWLR